MPKPRTSPLRTSKAARMQQLLVLLTDSNKEEAWRHERVISCTCTCS